jgi:hypothetical protein
VDQAADHRAPVADRRVGDVLQRLPQQRDRVAGGRVVLDGGVTGQRTDPDGVGVAADVGQLGEPVHVHQVRGGGQAHVEQRHQALAAGEHLAVVADLGQHGQRLLDRGGPVVLERRWLHVGIIIAQASPGRSLRVERAEQEKTRPTRSRVV